jgi:pimeloyl-ACP methyl ester carboxylesterase
MPDGTTASESPTVVLVHGAFADASSWNGVIKRLHAQGVPVTAPANPLRGVSTDSAYITGLLEQIPGPVVAVGHSYGGAVITNAATKANNAVGLVYVAAFATDEGERLADATGASKDAVLSSGLVELHYPAANGELAVEFAVDPARFHEILAADLSAEEAAVMAAIQRPIAELAFSDTSGPPAWRSVPSLRSWLSPTRRGHPPGGAFLHGPSSPPVTRPPAPMSPAQWRSELAQPSPKSTART